MAKDPKAHQLYKQDEGTALTIVNASAGTTTTTKGWNTIQADTNTVFLTSRLYIDLKGWTEQDLTTFVQGVDIQKQLIPIKDPGGGANTLFEFDFITTRSLTDSELINSLGFGAPGFGESTVDLMQVIYGERMIYAENATVAGTYLQISGETFGSGNPTAMDKLHWTRLIVVGSPSDGNQIVIYPTNLVVQAMTSKEKDLVWMERLRRSYVLQNEIV